MLKVGPLILKDLDQPYVAIIQHFTQRDGVIHQVTLRPDKVKDGLIRLGETPGDELAGWNYPKSITVVSVLGTGHRKTPPGTGGEDWECKPIESEAMATSDAKVLR